MPACRYSGQRREYDHIRISPLQWNAFDDRMHCGRIFFGIGYGISPGAQCNPRCRGPRSCATATGTPLFHDQKIFAGCIGGDCFCFADSYAGFFARHRLAIKNRAKRCCAISGATISGLRSVLYYGRTSGSDN